MRKIVSFAVIVASLIVVGSKVSERQAGAKSHRCPVCGGRVIEDRNIRYPGFSCVSCGQVIPPHWLDDPEAYARDMGLTTEEK